MPTQREGPDGARGGGGERPSLQPPSLPARGGNIRGRPPPHLALREECWVRRVLHPLQTLTCPPLVSPVSGRSRAEFGWPHPPRPFPQTCPLPQFLHPVLLPLPGRPGGVSFGFTFQFSWGEIHGVNWLVNSCPPSPTCLLLFKSEVKALGSDSTSQSFYC